MEYYTKKCRYFMTNGISRNVSPVHISHIINMINQDRVNKQEADYLKVWKLYPNREDKRLVIKESQEVPEFKREKTIPYETIDTPITIWSISDGFNKAMNCEVVTFLLPEEYWYDKRWTNETNDFILCIEVWW